MKKLRYRFFPKVMSSVICLSTVAVATPLVAVAQSNSADVVEEVFVTGSRIRRSNADSPTPVTVLGSEDLAAVGSTNVGEFLEKLPASIAASNQSNSTFGTTSAGLLTTALRNLEQERTLVLVNGRRFVSGVNPGVGYAVDLSSIPTALIENIEVLTGGASAIYGSDAVAGVVNIITKKNFEGVDINVRSGISAENDNEKNDFNITLGGNFDGDNGNAWTSFGISDENGIMARDRDFSDTDLIEYDSDRDGLADSHRFLGSSFLPQGRFGGFTGDGSKFQDSDRFNRAGSRQLLIPIERRYGAAGATFKFNERLRTGLQLGYNETIISSNIEPVPLDLNTNIWNTDRVDGGTGGHDIASSLLLPQRLKDNLLGEGYTNLTDLGNNLTSRRLVEFGSRGAEAERNTTHAVFDVTYDLNDNWTVDAFASWGKTRTILKSNGNFNVERAELALDVELIDPTNPDGGIQCKSVSARLAGCAPFNPFGFNSISPEAVKYLSAATTFRAEVEQTVFGASIAGDLPFELPGGAVSIAGGVEYREEKGSESPSGFVQSGIISGNAIAATKGQFDVTDVFVEARFPLHSKLALSAAYRVGDYSTVGNQSTWKVGLDSPITDSVRLRASVSESVRAPNISDLFAGAGDTFATVVDICEGVTETSGGAADANCRSIAEIAARIDADEVTGENDVKKFELTQVEKQSTGGFIGGNPNVKEETAESWTAGVVFTPEFVEGLSVAVDWYNIEIDNAIDITPRTTVVRRCYEVSAAEFDPTCGGAVLRSKGALVSVNSLASNENIIETAGLDLDASYTTELADWSNYLNGTLRFNLLYNYIDKFNTTGIIEGDVDEDRGEILWPKDRFVLTTTYNLNKLTVFWRARYWGEVNDSNSGLSTDEHAGLGSVPFSNKLNTKDDTWYHDVQFNYEISDSLDANIGVNNLLDQGPELLTQGSQHGNTGINTAGEAYDVIGRRYYAGIRYSF